MGKRRRIYVWGEWTEVELLEAYLFLIQLLLRSYYTFCVGPWCDQISSLIVRTFVGVEARKEFNHCDSNILKSF